MNETKETKFKVVLLGDGGVGKTSYVKRLKYGEFGNGYLPTMGVEIHPLEVKTNVGTYTLNLWDCAGQEKFSGLKNGYYVGANGAIIMFDVTSRISFNNAKKWYDELRGKCPNIQVILCGNKVDSYNRRVSALSSEVSSESFTNTLYFDLSVKSAYNFDKPIEQLLQNLVTFSHEKNEWVRIERMS